MNTLIRLKLLRTRPFCDTSLICVSSRFSQCFHTSSSFNAVDKLLLSQIRKKTGFPLSHCKKALELHENDLHEAEKWLQKEAEALGWAKASKLSRRATTQGLIGVHIKGNCGNLVEVNCETDFVAKNADFQALVLQVTEEFAATSQTHDSLEEPIKEIVDKQTLERMKTSEGKTLADLVAVSIGKIGENIQLSRGVKFVCPPDLDLVGYAHPPTPNDANLCGKYVAVVAFKNVQDMNLARQLSAHVVGMNPEQVGSLDDIEEKEDTDTQEEKTEVIGEDEIEDAAEHEIRDAAYSEEKTLVRQIFINNQDVKVGEILRENDLQIIDFVRLECGETRVSEN